MGQASEEGKIPSPCERRFWYQVKMNYLCMCHLALHSSKLLAFFRIVMLPHSTLLGCEKGLEFACSTPMTGAHKTADHRVNVTSYVSVL